MTIESGGQEWSFEGYLTQTDIQIDSEEEFGFTDMAARVFPRTNYTVDLSIQTTGEITRTQVPKKQAPNVQ